MKEDNISKRHKLSQAASHVIGVVSSCRPAFRHLNMSALQSCDLGSVSQFPQLPAKLQALYYHFASASVLASVSAQVCGSDASCNYVLTSERVPYIGPPVRDVIEFDQW